MVFREVDPAQEVVDRRVKGETFADIGAALQLPPERCAQLFHEYLNDSYGNISDVEMRLTQLKRLESLLSYLWDIVRSGDALTEGRQTANAIKIIEQINTLMGLHRDPLRDAQVELTKAQTELLYGVLVHMRTALLDRLVEGLRPLLTTEAGVPIETSEHLRSYIEAHWPRWHADAVTESKALLTGTDRAATPVAALERGPR